jgi:hypothetical protein
MGASTQRDPLASNASKRKEHAGTKKFEWVHASLEKFRIKLKSTTPAVFQTAKGPAITCTSQTGSGEMGETTVDEMEMVFTGCATPAGAPCKGEFAKASGEITFTGFVWELGVIKKGGTKLTDQIGLDLPVFRHLTCGATAMTIAGGVIVPVKTNKMLLSQSLQSARPVPNKSRKDSKPTPKTCSKYRSKKNPSYRRP